MVKGRSSRSKKNKNSVYRFISLVLLISTVFFLGILSYIDLLPSKYLSKIIIAILIFDAFNVFFINITRLKRNIKKFLATFMIIAISIMSVGTFYIGKTMGILINNGESKYKIENYSVIVLKKENYKKINDIKNKAVGYFEKSDGVNSAIDRLKSETKVELKKYNSSEEQINDLLNSNIDAILLEDSMLDILKEEKKELSSKIKVIYKFKISKKVELNLKDVNVIKKPFAIYISGIDTYGEISSVSRSDVNIVMVAHPKTHQVLLISIPRDYYVKLHGIDGGMDKLTHAGIYGIDMSIKTIEDLLDMDINYYLKVNFTSVIDIVNALGGLDVYSEYTFISYSGFSFKEGMNYVNGEQALDFARTRKAFREGDRQRGKNQQALIEAIIRKAISKKIITKYNSLLNAINGKYQTNMSMKQITSIIKKQLNDKASWTVTSYSLSGYDARDYTYTSNTSLYVMKPNEDSINEAIELIDKVLAGEKLDSSYNNLGGQSNKVQKAS